MSALLNSPPLKIELSSFPTIELSVTQVEACLQLTFGKQGNMSQDLVQARKEKRECRVILARDTDQRLVGWCLMMDRCRCSHFFVSEPARRQGVGSALMRESMRLSPNLVQVGAHDDASWYFFNQFKGAIKIAGFYLNCPEEVTLEESWSG